jgi:hypothetical protein
MVKKAWEIYAICRMLCALFEWRFSMINSAMRNIAIPHIAKNVGSTPPHNDDPSRTSPKIYITKPKSCGLRNLVRKRRT